MTQLCWARFCVDSRVVVVVVVGVCSLVRSIGSIEHEEAQSLAQQYAALPRAAHALPPHTATAHCHLQPALCGTRLTACRVRQVSTTPGAAPELLPELGAFVAANNSAVSPAVRARGRAAHADGRS